MKESMSCSENTVFNSIYIFKDNKVNTFNSYIDVLATECHCKMMTEYSNLILSWNYPDEEYWYTEMLNQYRYYDV
jgi:hypothetical protein